MHHFTIGDRVWVTWNRLSGVQQGNHGVILKTLSGERYVLQMGSLEVWASGGQIRLRETALPPEGERSVSVGAAPPFAPASL